jgi:glycosyltransferase involved in cell wall biosynthesis
VVLCLKASADVVGAVRSLLAQNTPNEVFVINSGGGDVGKVLKDAGTKVPFENYPERMFAGAARNRGIERTQAPYVAFLASDCLALEGWVEYRLKRHREGASAVACAIVNSHPRHLVACAAYIGMFMRRLPGLPDNLAIRFGASFDRRLFSKFGLFDETLPTSEDTEFLKRLPTELHPVWAPEVRTIHVNETRFIALIGDQFKRGIRYGRDMHRIFGKPHLKIARDVLRQSRHARRLARVGLAGPERTRVMLSMPILWVTLAAKASGVLVSGLFPAASLWESNGK